MQRTEQVAAAGLGVRRALPPVGEEVRAEQFAGAGHGVTGLDGVTHAEAGHLTVRRGSGVEPVREVDFFEHRDGDRALGHRGHADLAVGARHDAVLEDRAQAVAKSVDVPVRSVRGPGAGEESFDVEAGLTNDLGRGVLAVQAFGPAGRAHAGDGTETQPFAGDQRAADAVVTVDARGGPSIGGQGRGLEGRQRQLGGGALAEVAEAEEGAPRPAVVSGERRGQVVTEFRQALDDVLVVVGLRGEGGREVAAGVRFDDLEVDLRIAVRADQHRPEIAEDVGVRLREGVAGDLEAVLRAAVDLPGEERALAVRQAAEKVRHGRGLVVDPAALHPALPARTDARQAGVVHAQGGSDHEAGCAVVVDESAQPERRRDAVQDGGTDEAALFVLTARVEHDLVRKIQSRLSVVGQVEDRHAGDVRRGATQRQPVFLLDVGGLGDLEMHAGRGGFVVPHAYALDLLVAFDDAQRFGGEVDRGATEAHVGGFDHIGARVDDDLGAEDAQALGRVDDLAFGDDHAGAVVETEFLRRQESFAADQFGVRADHHLAAFFGVEVAGEDGAGGRGGGRPRRFGGHGRHGQGEACGKDPEATARHLPRVVAPVFPSRLFG